MDLQPHAELVLDFGRGPMRVHFRAGIAHGDAVAGADAEIRRVEDFAGGVTETLTAKEIERIKHSIASGGLIQ